MPTITPKGDIKNMAKKEEVFKSYLIPFNFIDESKMFGGMVKTRNFIEGCVCAFIASLPVFIIPFIGLKARLILFIVLVLPAFLFGCIGINGDPISRFILYYIKFKKAKRVVSFNNKVKLHERIDVNMLSETELPRDKLFKILNNLGVKRENAEEDEIIGAEEFVFDDDLEEIKKKEEEAKQMLKASSRYTQARSPLNTYSDATNLLTMDDIDIEVNSDIDDDDIVDDEDNDAKDDFLQTEIEDLEYEDDIPVLNQITPTPKDIDNNLSGLEDGLSLIGTELADEGENGLYDIEGTEALLFGDDENELIILSGDFIDDYKETKIAYLQPEELKPIEMPIENINDNNNIPKKKKIILPWYCSCGTKNLNEICTGCGTPKP